MSTAEARYSDLQMRITSGTHDLFKVVYSDFYVEIDSLTARWAELFVPVYAGPQTEWVRDGTPTGRAARRIRHLGRR